MKLTIALMIAIFGAFMAFLWVHNLPEWCAHPERPGNASIQPFCR